MPYTLDLQFKPGVEWARVLEYFSARSHYSVSKYAVMYENPDTETLFFFRFRAGRNILLQKVVSGAVFEINYFRPSYFGLEAEIELSAFVEKFGPSIFDDQIEGMGEGPYSGEGFLRGWNWGNVFSARSALAKQPNRDFHILPGDRLCAAWKWNYGRDTRMRSFGGEVFVPLVRYYLIENIPSRVITWGEGGAISLPHVDYALIGRWESRRRRFGLTPWSAIVEVAEGAGFDTTVEPLDLIYSETPPTIVKWFAGMPVFDSRILTKLEAYRIIDTEIIEAATNFSA